MCEHDRGFSEQRLAGYREACVEASAHGALLIPGIEYADPEDRVHVPVWGEVPFQGEGVPTTQLLESVRALGGFSLLAHPVRRDAWRIVDPHWLDVCDGIEIWTRKWDGWAPNDLASQWARKHELVSIVSLDLHHSRQTYPLAMELDVIGPLEPGAVLDAILQRRCRPMIGRLPVAAVSAGMPGASLQVVERWRRPLWRRLRAVRDRRRGVR